MYVVVRRFAISIEPIRHGRERSPRIYLVDHILVFMSEGIPVAMIVPGCNLIAMTVLSASTMTVELHVLDKVNLISMNCFVHQAD